MFETRNLAIFAILVLSLSVVSMLQASLQLVSGYTFSNEVNDLQYTTLYSTQKTGALEISDDVVLEKNNEKIQAIIFDKDTSKDSVAISDSVTLAKHVPVVYNSNWNTVAILDRITSISKHSKINPNEFLVSKSVLNEVNTLNNLMLK